MLDGGNISGTLVGWAVLTLHFADFMSMLFACRDMQITAVPELMTHGLPKRQDSCFE